MTVSTVTVKEEILAGINFRESKIYSGPCDLRPAIQPAKYGLKLKVVLK